MTVSPVVIGLTSAAHRTPPTLGGLCSGGDSLLRSSSTYVFALSQTGPSFDSPLQSNHTSHVVTMINCTSILTLTEVFGALQVFNMATACLTAGEPVGLLPVPLSNQSSVGTAH